VKKHALIVGVEEYRDRMISRVRFARADAQALAERLRERCAFDNVRLLADNSGEDEPLLVNILGALRDMSVEMGPDDLFLFFFAGHGIERNERGYLLTRDTIQAMPEYVSLPLDRLRHTLARLRAGQRILLLDACRNNPEVGRGGAANLMSEAVSRDIAAVAGGAEDPGATTALLAACSPGQRAYEHRTHGVFTHYLLEGLDGAAWEGEELRFETLAHYVHRRVCEWSRAFFDGEGRQVPWFEKFGAPRPIILASGRRPAEEVRAAEPQQADRHEAEVKEPAVEELDAELEQALSANGPHEDLLKAPCQLEAKRARLRQARRLPLYVFLGTAAGALAALLVLSLYLRSFVPTLWVPLGCALLGDANAQFQIGFHFQELGLQRRAVKWYREAAEQGHAEAQYNLALCYYWGAGVLEDKSEAVEWCRKAAEQGCAEAQYNLGICYELGDGVPQDKLEGVKWFRKAAEQGFVDAQYNLGWHYAHGDGVAQDKSEAVKWYRKAAEQGHAAAQNNLGNCYTHGEGVAQDTSEAVKWYRKAAEQGNPNAQYNLAGCYARGDGVRRDTSEAVKWYRKAAERGHAYAQYYLGWHYAHGDGVAQDKSEAVKWYRMAAEQGIVVAMYELGICYELGDGVAQDESEAVRWYRMAAGQGHEFASLRLKELED